MAVASVIAILPALLLARTPLAVGLAVGIGLAFGLALLAGRTGPASLVLGLVPTTILATSGLLPAATYFLPTAILGLSLVIYEAASFYRTRSIPALPSRPLIAFAALYVVAAAVSTVFSIRPATSIPYLVGIGIILIVTLWLGPRVLTDSMRTASLFALIGAAGVVVTAFSVLFSFTGPVPWFGRWLGVYLVNELTVNGRPTGITLLWTSGPFLAPGVQALVLVPAILALLTLRPRLGPQGRLVVGVALVVTMAGLLSTFARAGWVAVIVGSAILAIEPLRSRRIDLAASVVCVVMAIAFVALLLNAVGADYRRDLTAARVPEAVLLGASTAGDDTLSARPLIPGSGGSTQDRGGSELSGRLEIWGASVRAIEGSPWVGYGPGTNSIALDPYLVGASRRFAGLTSHNAWLRTWIELGIVGILAFAGFVIAAVIAGVRGRLNVPGLRTLRTGALAIFVALLAAQAFETFLLGGVSMPSFVWSMAAGLLALGAGAGQRPEPAAA